jgi:hypothetical protein
MVLLFFYLYPPTSFAHKICTYLFEHVCSLCCAYILSTCGANHDSWSSISNSATTSRRDKTSSVRSCRCMDRRRAHPASTTSHHPIKICKFLKNFCHSRNYRPGCKFPPIVIFLCLNNNTRKYISI